MPATIDVYRYEGIEVPVTLYEEYISLSYSNAVSLSILPWIQVRNHCSVSGRNIPTEAVLAFFQVIQAVQFHSQTLQPLLWVVINEIKEDTVIHCLPCPLLSH
jgi:hypothetical protein